MDRDYSMPSVAASKPAGPAPNAWDANKPKSAAAAKGMSLSKGKKSDAFFDALRQEEEAKGVHLPPAGLPSAAAAAGRAGPASAAAAVVEEQRAQHVMVAVEEQVNVSLERDGALRKMEVCVDVGALFSDLINRVQTPALFCMRCSILSVCVFAPFALATGQGRDEGGDRRPRHGAARGRVQSVREAARRAVPTAPED